MIKVQQKQSPKYKERATVEAKIEGIVVDWKPKGAIIRL